MSTPQSDIDALDVRKASRNNLNSRKRSSASFFVDIPAKRARQIVELTMDNVVVLTMEDQDNGHGIWLYVCPIGYIARES